jgi:serine/threonine protein kinase
MFLGTPEYMAPEQVEGEALDHRCDLFSLGCVLYRMATGESPFRRKDLMSTMMAVANKKPVPPRELEPSMPPALSELVLQLLAKEPAKRPQSARAVAKALERIEQQVPPRATSTRPMMSLTALKIRALKWPTAGRMRRVLAGAGVAACVLLMGLSYVLRRAIPN